jgi:hypothetical protein
MVFRNEARWAMDARWQGTTQNIELNSDLGYDGDDLPLAEPLASMLVLLRGLAKSMPHLPTIYKE